ncbi:response regulator transcription factor [Methyloversatilis sp. XJ19-49]|uniref:response regulator transcription factor n=1 Tax=Methyloversatilis sp. XJ19-49 TaxID=2963429 RepID=UPI00211C18AF|nr:response regulator transcription factor [Methyloversatilis sp. XJ19-49]MCQ9377740.1 response regulator transcription factor [Methyloversatilis sp. XJ19-49]
MNILLVEDETRVADFIVRGLQSEGWTVTCAGDGERGLELLAQTGFDIVLLDLMLPGISGQETCRRMRARSHFMPVLMLSALDSMKDRIEGLHVGADDYLPKPFNFDELVARIKAMVRRANAFRGAGDVHVLEFKGLRLDTRSAILSIEGEEVDMTSREREIMALFLSNQGKVFARERILNAIWGAQKDPLTNVVDVYIGRLRKKLGPLGDELQTVRGLGYRLGR